MQAGGCLLSPRVGRDWLSSPGISKPANTQQGPQPEEESRWWLLAGSVLEQPSSITCCGCLICSASDRLVFKGMGISRPDAVIGKCRMIRHSRDRKNEPNPERCVPASLCLHPSAPAAPASPTAPSLGHLLPALWSPCWLHSSLCHRVSFSLSSLQDFTMAPTPLTILFLSPLFLNIPCTSKKAASGGSQLGVGE